MPRNGEINKTFGVFRTLCCDAEIVICPNHKNLSTEWKRIPEIAPTGYKPNAKGKINLSQERPRKRL